MLVSVGERNELRGSNGITMLINAHPRTLALTLCGDLDASTLDAMPAGSLPIITR